MVWSNWRGAVVVMFAWVGLAWSQAPITTAPEGTGERIMTVHENGKSLRCRVLSTWHMEDGSKAYQLQALDSGEMLTIVEDGPGIVLQEPLLGGKVRSLPMRIFHWGSSRLAPQGVPTPPDLVFIPSAPNVERVSYQQVEPNAQAPIYSRPIGKETIIRWEEKNSRSDSPVIVKSKVPVIVDQNGVPSPNPNEPVVSTSPTETTIVEAPEKGQRLFPKIFTSPKSGGQPEMAAQGPYVQTGPTLLPNKVSATPLAQPRVITPNFNTPGTVVQAGAYADSNSNPKNVTQAPYVQVGATVLPNKAAPLAITQAPNTASPIQTSPSKSVPAEITQASGTVSTAQALSDKTASGEVVQALNTVNPTQTSPNKQADIIQASSNTASPTQDHTDGAPVAPPVAGEVPPPPPLAVTQAPPVNPPPPLTPASLPETSKVQAPVYQSGLTPLANSPIAPAPPLPTITKDPAPTTAETASNTKPADPANPNVAKTAKHPVLDKLQNWMNPKKDVAATKPADPKANPGTGADIAKVNGNPPAPPTTTPNSVPFSTAADPNGNVKSPAAPAPTANQNVATINPPAPETGLPVQDNPPTAQAAPKRDWRSMWGQPRDAKAQIPGQSLVNQANAKPDPNVVPLLPPASMSDNKTADILLNPEKFDPSGARLTPKGIHMNAYRGDPAQLMTKAPVANVAQAAAQSEVISEHAYPPTPPVAGNSGPVPPGGQSVLAAGANVPGQTPYVPALPTTVPEPYQPPLPPGASIPEPPHPPAYSNAFTPPPPPPSAQEQNPMTINAFSNMVPQPNLNQQPNMNQQPNPIQPVQRTTQVPTNAPNFPPANYQPNPMAQGYPVVPGYPPNPNTMMNQGMPNPYYYAPQGSAQPGQPQAGAVSPQGHPVAQINYPQNYQGPQAPNPIHQQGQPQTQVQATQYTPAPVQQPQANPALERRVVPGSQTQDPTQVMQVLRESPYPAQREWASNTLGTFDWRAHPEIVQVLLQVAQQDPAATVRASCVYSLGRMNAASEPVLSIMSTLRNDGDPRVRQEVEQALIRLGANKQQ